MLSLIFRNAQFRRMVSGSFISQLGSFFTYMLLIVLSYGVTKSIAVTMGVVAAETIGTLLSGVIAGVIVDRSNPTFLMFGADLISACIIGVLFWMPALSWVYYIASFLVAIMAGFSSPSFSKYQVLIVETHQLADSNAMIQVLREVVKIIGPALAVFVLSLLPEPYKSVGFLIDAASFILSAWFTLLVITHDSNRQSAAAHSPVNSGQAASAGFFSEWLAGIQLLGNPIILTVLILFVLILIGISGSDVTFTAYLGQTGHPTLDLGYIMASLSLGLILTASFLRRFFNSWPLSLRLGGSALAMGIFYGAIGMVHSLLWMMISSLVASKRTMVEEAVIGG